LPCVSFAHVKWFVNYDLLSPPRPAFGVLSSRYFILFAFFVATLIFVISLVDNYLTRRTPVLERRRGILVERVAKHFPLLLRWGVSAFFTAVFVYGCLHDWMILTPELRTHSGWICWVQLAIAICALNSRSAVISGVGIIFLYGFGISQYGFFHMLDYPIFLGVAAFLIVHSIYGEKKQEWAVSAVRICTAVTLLWASIEKFAFPEWSFMLMAQRPGLALGFDPEFYMIAAGFVEFCAAFLLIAGSLAARAAALVLLMMFTSAIVPFGVIDGIGHSVIIVVLLLLVFSDNRVAELFSIRRSNTLTATLRTSVYFGALLVFFFLYYASYYLSYGLSV
jgi:uncharacterized membrane protein YphA (DoxX/SURF4 family)